MTMKEYSVEKQAYKEAKHEGEDEANNKTADD
jgi:hypothetical protein